MSFCVSGLSEVSASVRYNRRPTCPDASVGVHIPTPPPSHHRKSHSLGNKWVQQVIANFRFGKWVIQKYRTSPFKPNTSIYECIFCLWTVLCSHFCLFMCSYCTLIYLNTSMLSVTKETPLGDLWDYGYALKTFKVSECCWAVFLVCRCVQWVIQWFDLFCLYQYCPEQK